MATTTPPRPAPSPSDAHATRAFATIVARCLEARGLAEAWDRAAAHIALTSLNAGLAARRATHDQGVFAALARETREITSAIRVLVAEGLPLARGLARRSIRVITATRDLEALRRARARASRSRRALEATAAAEAALTAAKGAMAPDLARLGALFRDLEWNLVRLRTVALYFRIEGSRDQEGEAGFLVTSAALVGDIDPLEGCGADLASTFQALVGQLATEEAPSDYA